MAFDQFYNIHDQAMAEQQRPPEHDSLAITLLAEFHDVSTRRHQYEEQWLEDLRQEKGIYEEGVREKLDKQPHRSKLFFRLTRSKKRKLCSKVIDLLFPANGEENWDISVSPEPQVPPQLLQEEAQRVASRGEDPNQVGQDYLRHSAAERACDRMRRDMRDQLASDLDRPAYRDVSAQVVGSGITFGTGVLKGPLVSFTTRDAWRLDEQSNWQMRPVYEQKVQPYYEAVSLWDTYPDLDAITPQQLRFVWQSHLMSKADLQRLLQRPDFAERAHGAREHLRNHPDGDASMRNFETQLRSLSVEQARDLSGRYRVLERWGYISGKALSEAGVPIPEEASEQEFGANVWILGQRIIKAVLAPVRGVVLPYYFFYYVKDETSIFGEGLPRDIRDPQRGLNASVRGMVDNASLSAGPQIGVNTSALHPSEDDQTIEPFRVWRFESASDMQKAMQVWDIPNNVNEFLALTKFFRDFADDVSQPDFAPQASTAASREPAQALSMRMSASHIDVKELVRGYDDTITRPFIRNLYHWNMQFSRNHRAKGDYQVQARGSSALVAKELQTQKLLQAAELAKDPENKPYLRRHEMLKAVFESADLKPTLVRTEEEAEQYREKELHRQAQVQAKAQLETLLDEARSRGMNPEETLQNMLAQAAQQQQALNQQEPPRPPDQAPQPQGGAL